MSGGGGKVGPSKQEKELAKIAQENWDRYKEKFMPVEDAFIDDVMAWGAEEEQRDILGDAIGKIRGQTEHAAPTPGRTGGAGFGDAIGHGLTRGVAMGAGATEASLSAENRHLAGVQKLLGLGKNLREQHRTNLSRGAATENYENRASALSDASRDASMMQGIGTIAGAGAGIGQANNWWQTPKSAGAPYVPSNIGQAASRSGGGFASRPDLGL